MLALLDISPEYREMLKDDICQTYIGPNGKITLFKFFGETFMRVEAE
jgi:hypothetical protein